MNTAESSAFQEPSFVGGAGMKATDRIVLYAVHDVPFYQQDNRFILSGYRGELKSFKLCLGSLWYLHNETGKFACVFDRH